MKLLEKILVPVDVNTDSKEQIDAAIEIARSYNSEIIIVYVLSNKVVYDDIKKIVMLAVTKSLGQINDRLHSEGIASREPIIAYGKPTNKILQVAMEENVNLILTGSGSKNENEKFKLGMTAEKLVLQSEKPVWVVKSNGATRLTNILCPVDFSDPSKQALKNAILLAKHFKASLRILGVYEPFTNNSPKLNLDLEKENAHGLEEFENNMNLFLQDFDLKGLNHKIEIKTGDAHLEILETIKEHGHDLLLMGTNGRSGLNKFIMGSVTEKVTREMPCSFVTTKTQDIIQLKLSHEVKEIEIHIKNAEDLIRSGFYKEAIAQYKFCLQINDMYIPAMYKLAEVHRILGNTTKADYYANMAKDLVARLWDKKIEQEIRKHYRTGK